MVSDIQLYDESHPYDTAAILPVVGAPFAYHQFRSGRSNWESTAAALLLGAAVTEGAFYVAGRTAGFTSLELFLGRGLGAAGFTWAGRHYAWGMLMTPANTSGLGWRVPTWVWLIGAYEISMYWGDRVELAHRSPKMEQFEQFH